MANLHFDWVSTRALAVIAGTVGVVHYLLVRFRFKEIGKYLAGGRDPHRLIIKELRMRFLKIPPKIHPKN